MLPQFEQCILSYNCQSPSLSAYAWNNMCFDVSLVEDHTLAIVILPDVLMWVSLLKAFRLCAGQWGDGMESDCSRRERLSTAVLTARSFGERRMTMWFYHSQTYSVFEKCLMSSQDTKPAKNLKQACVREGALCGAICRKSS